MRRADNVRELMLELIWQCGSDDCIASNNLQPGWLNEYEEDDSACRKAKVI